MHIAVFVGFCLQNSAAQFTLLLVEINHYAVFEKDPYVQRPAEHEPSDLK